MMNIGFIQDGNEIKSYRRKKRAEVDKSRRLVESSNIRTSITSTLKKPRPISTNKSEVML
jgi:hypothetical protein